MIAYGTDDGFTAYHSARGRAVQIADHDADEIAAARLVASEFIDGRYQASFPGTKIGMRAQVREWPRQGGSDRYGYAIASEVVPIEIDNATYEAAFRQLSSPGSLTKDWTPGKYKSVSVDGAVSATYATFGSAADVQTQYAIIDQILSPILTGAGNSASLSGSISRQ